MRNSKTLLLASSILALLFTGMISSQNVAADDYDVPRTAHGYPDLQGVWSNATLTTLERPKFVGGKATLTVAEAQQWEQRDESDRAKSSLPSDPNAPAPEAGENVGGYNRFWIDPGTALAMVGDEIRTSLITYPTDGQIPYLPARESGWGSLFKVWELVLMVQSNGR